LGIAALAREFSAEAIEKLIALMRKPDLDPRAVIAAINSLLDRGIGKLCSRAAAAGRGGKAGDADIDGQCGSVS
jgi:hypothetical protein